MYRIPRHQTHPLLGRSFTRDMRTQEAALGEAAASQHPIKQVIKTRNMCHGHTLAAELGVSPTRACGLAKWTYAPDLRSDAGAHPRNVTGEPALPDRTHIRPESKEAVNARNSC